MFDDGIYNEFEGAHQKGLRRGFDLGWSYKGRFDRQIILDYRKELEDSYPKDTYAVNVLSKILDKLEKHENNREFISHG
jgi:hypothetical protein